MNIYLVVKSKQERHKIIKEVVGKGKVSSQEELAEILENNGIQVAQATLSRDIRDLGITKLHDGEGYYYSLSGVSSRPSGRRFPSSFVSVSSIEFTGSLAVVKTMPGHANMVAALIDSVSLPEVAGTIAGDDTIMLAIREGVSREELLKSLGRLLSGLESVRLN
ncbi:MAG: ArgR family transcriptional regulator [Bacteroidales bacterium]|nr:ArgR family transcriptional regulator [Bacteroidales bacterium]